jgi:VanZ family protein
MADHSEHPAGDVTRAATRLALALLGYFALVTLVITLSPFDFALRRVRVSFLMKPGDILANVALFLPIGFLLRSLAHRSLRRGHLPVWIAAVFSLLVEGAQMFIHGRFASPVDVAANTCGAYLGLVTRDRLERWALWHPSLVGRVGLDLPLVGLLYLLVPQLWLSGVGLVGDPLRSATTLLLACAGSIILVDLHRHRWQGGVHLAARAVPPIALFWFTVGALPALSTSPRAFAGIAVSVVCLTAWLLGRSEVSAEQRFEVDTLRRFLPVFVLYLIVASLWPPMRSTTTWHGAVGFADRLHNAGVVDVLLLLEQVGGFTLLGYALAEWRGRQELSLAADLPRVILVAAAVAGMLELVQGVLAGPGASVLRALLSTSGAGYGAAVYHLARAHVRALRATAAADDRVTEAA